MWLWGSACQGKCSLHAPHLPADLLVWLDELVLAGAEDIPGAGVPRSEELNAVQGQPLFGLRLAWSGGKTPAPKTVPDQWPLCPQPPHGALGAQVRWGGGRGMQGHGSHSQEAKEGKWGASQDREGACSPVWCQGRQRPLRLTPEGTAGTSGWQRDWGAWGTRAGYNPRDARKNNAPKPKRGTQKPNPRSVSRPRWGLGL